MARKKQKVDELPLDILNLDGLEDDDISNGQENISVRIQALQVEVEKTKDAGLTVTDSDGTSVGDTMLEYASKARAEYDALQAQKKQLAKDITEFQTRQAETDEEKKELAERKKKLAKEKRELKKREAAMQADIDQQRQNFQDDYAGWLSNAGFSIDWKDLTGGYTTAMKKYYIEATEDIKGLSEEEIAKMVGKKLGDQTTADMIGKIVRLRSAFAFDEMSKQSKNTFEASGNYLKFLKNRLGLDAKAVEMLTRAIDGDILTYEVTTTVPGENGDITTTSSQEATLTETLKELNTAFTELDKFTPAKLDSEYRIASTNLLKYLFEDMKYDKTDKQWVSLNPTKKEIKEKGLNRSDVKKLNKGRLHNADELGGKDIIIMGVKETLADYIAKGVHSGSPNERLDYWRKAYEAVGTQIEILKSAKADYQQKTIKTKDKKTGEIKEDKKDRIFQHTSRQNFLQNEIDNLETHVKPHLQKLIATDLARAPVEYIESYLVNRNLMLYEDKEALNSFDTWTRGELSRIGADITKDNIKVEIVYVPETHEVAGGKKMAYDVHKGACMLKVTDTAYKVSNSVGSTIDRPRTLLSKMIPEEHFDSIVYLGLVKGSTEKMPMGGKFYNNVKGDK